MSWNNIDPRIRHIAESELTPKQLDVWKLHLAGCGTRRAARMLATTRSTIRDHLDAAHTALETAGVTRHPDGTYHLAHEEAA